MPPAQDSSHKVRGRRVATRPLFFKKHVLPSEAIRFIGMHMFPHLVLPLKQEHGSYAMLSTNPVKRTAIVFVHGFAGDAMTTWLQFQTLIDLLQNRFPHYAASDLYFYSYDSLKTKLPANAQRCLDFIHHIYPRPDRSSLIDDAPLSFLPDVLQSTSVLAASYLPESYQELILVGHSLGGVVIRMAVWFALRGASDPTAMHAVGARSIEERCRFVIDAEPVLSGELTLFGPAILGSRLPVWMSQALALVAGIPSAGPAILQTLGLALPSIYELQCEDKVLSDLRRFTEDAADQFPFVKSLRGRVMWGEQDKVVEMWQYKYDNPVRYLPKIGHMNVCKPSQDHTDPLAFVIYGRETQTTAG